MGIVELESHFLIELADIAVGTHIFCHSLLHGSGDKEILLLQAQFLARIVVVVGIEHLHDISRQVLLLHGLLIIALVKGIQLETHHRLRVPDPQGVHDMVAIAHDGQIKGNGIDGLVTLLGEMLSAVLVPGNGHITSELYLFFIFGSAQFKGLPSTSQLSGTSIW